MSDWQPGDLALCVKLANWRSLRLGSLVPTRAFGPQAGVVYVVERLNIQHRPSGLGLMFSEWPLKSFGAHRFRKLTPPEADEFDREVIELMKPAKVPA